MPVIIENFSPRGKSDDQTHYYGLRINSQHVTYFEHRRDMGLAECLRRAADAVEAVGADEFPIAKQ